MSTYSMSVDRTKHDDSSLRMSVLGISFRDSCLAHLFQSIVAGKSAHVVFLSTVSPSLQKAAETNIALRYVSDVKKVFLFFFVLMMRSNSFVC